MNKHDRKEKESDHVQSHGSATDETRVGEESTHPAGDSVLMDVRELDRLKEEAKKASEHWERLQRTQADFENSRKRLQKESQERVRYANEALIRQVLSVADDLDRALQAMKDTSDAAKIREGIDVVQRNLKKVLNDQGVAVIESKGEMFDPHQHEAVGTVESDEWPDGTVVEEIQRGYRLHDRVIRPSVVKIAAKKG